MKWIALVPMRGGSKSIPDKNIIPVAGRPLCCWAIEAAVKSNCFDEIWVSTDSEKIGRTVNSYFPEVRISDRPGELATDEASTESVMLDFIQKVPGDILCTIQATSPLTAPEDFIRAKSEFLSRDLDALLTGVECKRFFWDHQSKAINYDPCSRPRRQDFTGCIMENGAFYMTRYNTLAEHKNRIGGKTAIHVMGEETAFEIDEFLDLKIVEQLLLDKNKTVLTGTARIKALFVDVDGTLTDGGMYYSENGEELKKFNTRDAHGLGLIKKAGLTVGIITAEKSPAVRARMKKLEIEQFHEGVKNKRPYLEALCRELGLTMADVAYIGDDLGDLEVLQTVGFSACPADAHPAIKSAGLSWICKNRGGDGAVREVCDYLLNSVGIKTSS